MKKEIMYCRNCGKPVPLDSKFCQHCGTAVELNPHAPTQNPDSKSSGPNGLSSKYVFIGVIAGLILTAVCTPLVLLGRSEISRSLLNPENRTFSAKGTQDNPTPFHTLSEDDQGESTQGDHSVPGTTTSTPFLEYPDFPMVFASDRDDPNFEECSQTDSCWPQVYYTSSLLTGTPTNLTLPLGFGSATYPSLSPDGTKVAFTGFMPGDSENHIYVVNIDGTGLQKVSQESYTHMYSSWAPDSTQVVYMSKPDTGTFFNLFIADINSSKIRQLTSGDFMDRFPSWSPDGSYVAFHTNREDPDPESCWPHCLFVIYIINVETSEGGPAKDNGNLISGGALDWSPDGKQLAFHSDRDGNWNIYLMQQDGSVSQFTSSPADELFPRWSPNGKFIAFTNQTENKMEIAVTPADRFEPEYYISGGGKYLQQDW